jgi:hypothetical protein
MLEHNLRLLLRLCPAESVGMFAWLSNLRSRGVMVRATALGAVMLAALAATAPAAIQLGGVLGLAAAAIAAVLCLAGASAALVIVDRCRTPGGALAGLWIGMMVRTGVPFAIGLPIHLYGGPLAQAGLLWYLLLFYLIALAVGTFLSLPPTKRRPTPAR